MKDNIELRCTTIGELRQALKEFSDDTPFDFSCYVTIYYGEKTKIFIE